MGKQFNPNQQPVEILLWNGQMGQFERMYAADQFVRLGSGSGISISTIATVWDPGGSSRLRLLGGTISVSAAGQVLFEDNTAGAGNFVWETPKLAQDSPYNFDLGNGKPLSNIANVLKATGSVAMTIYGTLYGCLEAA
jgi:hypothetical protein